MSPFFLSDEQQNILDQSAKAHIFLEGPAGTGKTTVGVERMLSLIDQGIPAEQILVLVPQRTLAFPYYEGLHHPDLPAGGSPTIVTLGGLAQRLIDLFWPVIAENAGFAFPEQPPHFLTLETAQYYMASIVSPLLEQGYFDTIEVEPNRLFSQILDNLNKAASIGIPHTTIGDRLKHAWIGKPAQLQVYEEAQLCANLFRDFCLKNNLLDFSLQLEVFTNFLWTLDICQQYLINNYRYLIYDNIEEDIPIAHDIIHQWLSNFDSALLIYDLNGGYRSFLGADPESAANLNQDCGLHFSLSRSLVNSPALDNLQESLANCMLRREVSPSKELLDSINFSNFQFYPQMVEAVSSEINRLVNEENVAPGEITVLAPFMTDSLRFALMNRLDVVNIPYRSHRPSRSLRDEPATQCLLALAKLAHPQWQLFCSSYELRSTFMQSIQGMDMNRADFLSRICYREAHPEEGLQSFESIIPEMQERITYTLGDKYEELRRWIEQYRQSDPQPLDVFISLVFGELLSQPGFGFHYNFDAANVASLLVESIQKFRWVTASALEYQNIPLGKEYIEMVERGVIAAQYLQNWSSQPEDAVLLAPAHTFLMTNLPASYQFWLDVGSLSWWQRLEQPLTHPYVLSRQWAPEQTWTNDLEIEFNQRSLERISRGLIRRCRSKIYIFTTDINEQGDQQHGPLLQATQILMRRYIAEWGVQHV